MSSCGNPANEDEALMRSRQRFDKSSICVKCKTERGRIVIRHSVYCKHCFFSFVNTKFRRGLDPYINASAQTSHKASLQAQGSLLIGFSGGIASRVLLDMLSRVYFTAPDHKGTEAKGGKSHPRNKKVWEKAYVCYVDTSSAYQDGGWNGASKEEVRQLVANEPAFEFVSMHLEDAFDSEWWSRVSGRSPPDVVNVDINAENLPVHSLPASSNTMPKKHPRALLRDYLSALPTSTAVESAIKSLLRLVLLNTARSLQCSHLALGTSLTSLAVSLITSISQGGGPNIPEEIYEECPRHAKATLNDIDHDDNGSGVRIVKPLRDMGMKECAAWLWWHGLDVAARVASKRSDERQTIGQLTKNFIVGLERDYPSTVSTITRTCGKVLPKDLPSGYCILCERKYSNNVLAWKSRISIRKWDKHDSSISHGLWDGRVEDATRFGILSPHLCYACHTLFTSRSSRSTVAPQAFAPLPEWTASSIGDKSIGAEVQETGFPKYVSDDDTDSSGVWKKLSREEMKDSVTAFLLE